MKEEIRNISNKNDTVFTWEKRVFDEANNKVTFFHSIDRVNWVEQYSMSIKEPDKPSFGEVALGEPKSREYHRWFSQKLFDDNPGLKIWTPEVDK